MPPPIRQTSIVGAASEHHVMSQLLLRGSIAALAPPGVPNIDILISDRDGKALKSIQVKGRSIGSDRGWMMNERHETLVHDALFYCFVDFSAGFENRPTTWIIPSAKVADVLAWSHAGMMARPTLRGGERLNGKMRRLLPDYSAWRLTDYHAGWLTPYHEQWGSLKTEF